MYFLNIVSRTYAEMIINGLSNTNQRNREFVSDVRFTYFFNNFSFHFYLFLAMVKKNNKLGENCLKYRFFYRFYLGENAAVTDYIN